MVAPKYHRSDDRRGRSDSVRMDSTGLTGKMAIAACGLADRDSDNPYREHFCGESVAERLRDQSGHLVLSSVRDALRSYRFGAAQAQSELETLANALGLFASAEKVEAILHRFGGLRGLLAVDAEELTSLLGNGDDATKVSAVLALADELRKPANFDHPVICDCSDMIAYLQNAMGHCRVETFRVLFLDTHNKIIADEVLWTGTVSEVHIYPREILRRALELDSSAFIAAHNHPSNVVTPSKSDIAMTRKLLNAASSLNIAFHDHIVVSATNFHSMRVHKSIDPWG